MNTKTKRALVEAGTTSLELAGAGLVVWGVAMFSLPVAVILAGLALIGLSFLITGRRGVRR